MGQHIQLPKDVQANLDHAIRIRQKIDRLEATYRESVAALDASISRHKWTFYEALELYAAIPDDKRFTWISTAFSKTGWSRGEIRYSIQEDDDRGGILNRYIPPKGTPTVYALIEDGQVVYVGRSMNVRNRMKQHRKSGNTYDDYEIYICGSDNEMKDLEAVLIQQHHPRRNVRVERRTTS